ncbi:DUF1573 domain-containing protein [Candidatus Daviesbacteria bacterium]|nr:DUF1573 domain-containing protein [Candidatus Daviesbacteria bacterium]
MDKKIIIAAVVITLLVLGGAVVLLGKSSSTSTKASLEKIAGAKVEAKETSFDFKDVPYSGGNVEHAFPIKNSGDKDLKIANLVTSCMCTKVYMKTSKEKSPEFGMKGHEAASNWTGTLTPGEEGQVVAVFDPTAHGPQGVGPISRLVSFETNDPDHPYMEFGFSGTVIK